MIILLPCYNEENSINNVLNSIVKIFPNPDIIVVDDGSTDRTYQKIKEAEKTLNIKNLTVLKHKKNRGLGKAISTGLNFVIDKFQNGSLVIIDADESHPVEMAKRMDEILKEKNFDIIIASRYVKGGKQINLSFTRDILSRIFSKILHIFYPEITDFSSGFRCYSVDFLKKNFKKFNLDRGFASSFELLIEMIKKGARIKELPLILDYSKKSSTSKFNFKEVFLSYIRVLFKIL